jgi:hypothetical protein
MEENSVGPTGNYPAREIAHEGVHPTGLTNGKEFRRPYGKWGHEGNYPVGLTEVEEIP